MNMLRVVIAIFLLLWTVLYSVLYGQRFGYNFVPHSDAEAIVGGLSLLVIAIALLVLSGIKE